VQFKLNDVVKYSGGATTTSAHTFYWLVLTDATPAQLYFPYFYWEDLLTYQDQ